MLDRACDGLDLILSKELLMPRPVLDPQFWAERLENAEKLGQLHRAVFECSLDMWRLISDKHQLILQRHVYPVTRVLDAGCGWGRLLDLMPEDWRYGLRACPQKYLGVDLFPGFVELAKKVHPEVADQFAVSDLRDLSWVQAQYNLGVVVSVRPMVVRELGQTEWDRMEVELRKHCHQLLYLEFDPEDEGSLE